VSAIKRPAAPHRVAFRREEAAAALGVSRDHFDRFVRPHLPTVRLGRVKLYPVAGIERFLEEAASSTLADAFPMKGEGRAATRPLASIDLPQSREVMEGA
jgi:hypothetical protein